MADVDVVLANYLRHIVKPDKGGENIFTLPYGCVIIRNCKSNGELVSFETIQEFKDANNPFWILCKLMLFRDQGQSYGEYVCTTCPRMKTMEGLHVNQPRIDIEQRRCHHAKAVHALKGDWQDHWNIPELTDSRNSAVVFLHEDLEVRL